MATATITMTQEEAQRLSEARKQLTDAERALKQTEAQITEESDKLADLQAQRTSECELLALGRRAVPSKFDAAVHATQDKLAGLGAAKRTRERGVADARATFYNVDAELARLNQQKLIDAETRETAALIETTRLAIQKRDDLERAILDGITGLRSRKYLLEANRRIAFDAAQALQRISVGMRP
jgi:hypothetical protein